MSEKLFKRLILLQLGAFGLTIIFLAVEAGDTKLEAITQIIGEYSLISQASSLTQMIADWISALSLILSVVSLVGLYYFKRWARWLYLAVIAYDIISYLYWLPEISLPVSSLLFSVISILDGMILCAVFFTSLSHKFKYENNQKDQDTQ